MTGQVFVNVETSPLGLRRYVCSWIADSSGVADIDFDGREAPLIEGDPVRLVTVPSEGSPPLAGYDVKLLTCNGFDILVGAGGDRSATEVETVGIFEELAGGVRFTPNLAIGQLRLCFENTSDGGAGTVILYIS